MAHERYLRLKKVKKKRGRPPIAYDEDTDPRMPYPVGPRGRPPKALVEERQSDADPFNQRLHEVYEARMRRPGYWSDFFREFPFHHFNGDSLLDDLLAAGIIQAEEHAQLLAERPASYTCPPTPPPTVCSLGEYSRSRHAGRASIRDPDGFGLPQALYDWRRSHPKTLRPVTYTWPDQTTSQLWLGPQESCPLPLQFPSPNAWSQQPAAAAAGIQPEVHPPQDRRRLCEKYPNVYPSPSAYPKAPAPTRATKESEI